MNSYVALYLVTGGFGFAVNVHVPWNVTFALFTVNLFCWYPSNVHLPSATVTSVCAGSLAITSSPFVYSLESVGINASTSPGNCFPAVELANA